MKSKSIFIKGIKVHPFPSDSSLLEYVEEHKGILVAINAEKILHANEQIQDIVNRNIGYCDGIGAVMAARSRGCRQDRGMRTVVEDYNSSVSKRKNLLLGRE